MTQEGTIVVRNATINDLPALCVLEDQVWRELGTPLLTAEHFETWLKINPEHFLVAIHKGKLVGSFYAQVTNFNPSDLDRFVSYDQATDNGYTITTHDPKGNSLNGISVTSIMRGAGKELVVRMHEMREEEKRDFFFGFSRVSEFSEYVRNNQAEIDNLNISKEECLIWYVYEMAKMVDGIVWSDFPAKPLIYLPSPDKRDVVLTKHLKQPGYGALRILPNFMLDPQSYHYAILVCTNPDKV